MENEKEILKWFNNTLSDEEAEGLKKSLDNDTLEKIEYYSAQLETKKIDPQVAFEAFKAKQINKKQPKLIAFDFKTTFKIAATITVLLTSAYFLFFNSGNTTFETQVAQTQSLYLPDSSAVVLNSVSKISWNEKNWKNKRNLTLEGEAYFKVKKGQKFTVQSNSGIVTVLGTQFNIKERKNYFEVHCYEGLVSVTHENKTIKLPPGKTYKIVNGQITNTQDNDVANPSWIQKESTFNSIPLKQVLDELQRQYDLQIVLKNVATDKLFSGSFTHQNQKIALDAITIPLKLSYKLEGKKVTIYNYENK